VVYSHYAALIGETAVMKRRPARVVDLLNPAAVLLPAANVIMQLSSPAVGHGVRHHGLPATGVPGADAVAVDLGPAAKV
jgi:hypothetical protein